MLGNGLIGKGHYEKGEKGLELLFKQLSISFVLNLVGDIVCLSKQWVFYL